MKKVIDGKDCELRDVIYSDFGATTQTEKVVQELRSSDEFKQPEDRAAALEDREYSWGKLDESRENPLMEEDSTEFDNQYGEPGDRLFSDLDGTELRDTEYSQLMTRLQLLKRPLHMQLKELYRDHSRLYKSRAGRMKSAEVDLLLDDYRYELHRILAKAKDTVVHKGGNLDTILKLSQFGGGQELSKTARTLTILFRRVEKAYDKFGFIPRDYQTQLNDAISILVSTLVMDIYGPEMERRKVDSTATSPASAGNMAT